MSAVLDLPPLDELIEGGTRWLAHTRVEKWGSDEAFVAGEAPDEVVEDVGNLLVFGGISNLLQCLLGNGAAAGGAALTYFNAANAALGVGDSTTAAVASQTDLAASTNKFRKLVSSVAHTDGVTASSNTVTFVANYASGEANFAWNEWGIFNSAAAQSGGRMLNRKVASLGAKSSGTWQLTVTVTLS